MRRSLLNKQILPKPLRQALVLITLLLLPSAAWADITYGGNSLTFNYSGTSGPNFYYSGTSENQVREWNATSNGDYYQASTYTYSGFSYVKLTYVNPLSGPLTGFTLAGSIINNNPVQSNNNNVNLKVYKLATIDATEGTLIGTIAISGTDVPSYTYTAENGVSQSFNNEYIQLSLERISNDINPTFQTGQISSITLTFSGTDYGISVGNYRVTSNNASNVLSDATSSVSYDDNNKELTLNGATITGDIIKSSSADDKTLIIKLKESNSLTGSIFFDENNHGDLTFTGTGSLNIVGEGSIFENVNSVNTSEGLYIATDEPNILYTNRATISTTEAYPIWVYNTSTEEYTQLTATASTYTTPTANVDENHNGSVSYSANNNTLTLDNFLCKTTDQDVFVFHIGSSLTNLTVDLVGTNEIFYNCFYYHKPAGGENLQLTYTTSSSNGRLEFSGGPTYNYVDCAYDDGLGFYSTTISTDWPRLEIGSTKVTGTTGEVTSGEGYYMYDDNTKTLTLSGATIGDVSSTNTDISVYLDDLTVEISGTNTIYGRFWGQYSENGSFAGKINFKNADFANASLLIHASPGLVYEFTDCQLSKDIKITEAKYNQASVDVNAVTYENGNFVYGSQKNVLTEITLSYQTPITVAGASPDSEGKFNGIDNVTFTPATQSSDGGQTPGTPATLTLSGATINGVIEWNSNDDLVIALNGENSITNDDGNTIEYTGSNSSGPTLTFAKAEGATNCELTLTHGEGSTFTFISNLGYADPDNYSYITAGSGLYYIIEDETTATVTSSILGGGSGTSRDPFLIKTAQHLKDFASYVNKGVITTEFVKLDADISWSASENFEPIGQPFKGTFTGGEENSRHTISNLKITISDGNSTGYSAGLFGKIDGGTVKNITLDGCIINGGTHVGGIVGEIYSNATIDNCVVSNLTITSSNTAYNPEVGGIAGENTGATISNCQVVLSPSSITASTNNDDSGAASYAGGIVGYTTGGTFTNNSVTSNAGTSQQTTPSIKATHSAGGHPYAGTIIGYYNDGNTATFTNNTYASNVYVQAGNDSGSSNDPRGIGNPDPHDIPNQVMMAGTKKVNISITDLSGDRTLSPGEDMGSTYYLEEYDDSPGPLKALYVLPGNNVSLIVSSENGHKPTFTLSDNDVTVTTTPEFESESDFWKIKYDFKMPEDDVTATIAFAIDLASQLYTLETDQEAYTYTGDGIEPSISLTISTDQDNPVTLTKGTDYEIQKCMKDVEGTLTPIFEEDGKTPKTPVDAGSYQIYISGIGSYTGEAVLEFSIEKRDANLCLWFYHLVDGKEEQVMTSEEATYGTAYNAPKLKNPFNLAVTLSCNSNNAENGTPSDVATIDADGNLTILKAGTVYVYAVTEGNDNCNGGDVHYQLNIGKGSLGNVTITEIEDQVYTGSAIEPELTVTTPDGTSVTTDDYSITFSDNINAGEVTITLTAKEISEKYEGSTTATFTIKQLDISEADITLDNTELTYNGEQQTVNVTKVMVGDIEVPVDCYEVSGKTGTEAKDYTLTVSAKTQNSDGSDFKNNFTGSASITWKINHRTASATELGFSTETQTASTYYNPNEDFNLPEGYVGYIITGINGTEVLTTRVSYIPKGIAVLVEKGTSSENATDEVPNPDLLPLKGTLEPKDVTSITGGTVYVLYNGEFVKSTSGTIPGKRCYLLIDTSVAAGTRSFSIDHGDGSTGIDSALVYDNDEKAGDKWHDLQGRSIEKPTRAGLYIKNGKKVVIK